MGLDMYIDARRNIGTPQEERVTQVYWRKFWDLHNYITSITDATVDDGCVEDTRLTLEDLGSIITFCCLHRDYFDGFDSVPDLCEVQDEWASMVAEGWSYWYNANW